MTCKLYVYKIIILNFSDFHFVRSDGVLVKKMTRITTNVVIAIDCFGIGRH